MKELLILDVSNMAYELSDDLAHIQTDIERLNERLDSKALDNLFDNIEDVKRRVLSLVDELDSIKNKEVIK